MPVNTITTHWIQVSYLFSVCLRLKHSLDLNKERTNVGQCLSHSMLKFVQLIHSVKLLTAVVQVQKRTKVNKYIPCLQVDNKKYLLQIETNIVVSGHRVHDTNWTALLISHCAAGGWLDKNLNLLSHRDTLSMCLSRKFSWSEAHVNFNRSIRTQDNVVTSP